MQYSVLSQTMRNPKYISAGLQGRGKKKGGGEEGESSKKGGIITLLIAEAALAPVVPPEEREGDPEVPAEEEEDMLVEGAFWTVGVQACTDTLSDVRNCEAIEIKNIKIKKERK